MRLSKHLKCLAIAIVIAFTTHIPFSTAQITNADYAANPSLQWVSVSPSGTRLAFRYTTDEMDLIRVMDLKAKKMLAGFRVDEITPQQIYFIDDDRIVLVAKEEKRVHGFKGIIDMSSAFVYSIKKNAIRQLLIPGEVVYKGQSGMGDIVGLSPDGQFAYMPAFAEKRMGSSAPTYSLLKVSLGAKKKKPKIIQHGNRHTIDYFLDGEGNILAIEKYNEDKHLYTVEVPDGKKWRVIYSDDSDLRDFGIWGIAPDKKHLVLVNEDPDTGFDTCYTMSLEDGKISGKLFGRADKDIDHIITDINRVIYGVRYSGFTPTYEFFDKKLTERVANIQKKFEGESVFLRDWSADWKHIVVQTTGTVFSGDYFLLNDGEATPIFVGSKFEKFGSEQINPIVKYNYKARDELDIPVLITLPRSQKDSLKNLPAIMMPHGGPRHHDKFAFDWMAQAFANAGYVVIQPQFRGSDGFGLAHLLAGKGEWGGKMQTDLLDGIDMLVKQGFINKDRVCIVGWSYGGYAALAGGAFYSDYYKCVVSVNGVSDVYEIMKDEKRDNHRVFDTYAYWKSVIGEDKMDKESLAAISPSKFADNFNVPVLLIYGDKDEVVAPEQTKIMYKALKKADKQVEVIRMKGEEHSFDNPENREKTLDAIIEFVNKNI
ncbi:alpha/beta hydrolase family protein [Saccharophagus degradans]|uniref:Peptidase S9, prolyl oligopeptidase active site region n=1 Tax=Saccharophagus degradans (strain 2-40 / ATCC 43961 / DSM 17024) TaxID=203122 RepID=Q21PQ4_SACD2|nr:prolyl oligopeptidase family serine peptidase [Saccharophagus degradans]ABD79325.1 peptidase S9, prolyl oligopeptidase active site region [Saccharophagus degradans 2-40]